MSKAKATVNERSKIAAAKKVARQGLGALKEGFLQALSSLEFVGDSATASLDVRCKLVQDKETDEKQIEVTFKPKVTLPKRQGIAFSTVIDLAHDEFAQNRQLSLFSDLPDIDRSSPAEKPPALSSGSSAGPEKKQASKKPAPLKKKGTKKAAPKKAAPKKFPSASSGEKAPAPLAGKHGDSGKSTSGPAQVSP